MSSLGLHFRRSLLTGLLVIGPLGISVWVLYRLFVWIDHLPWERLRLSFLHRGGIPGVGFVIVLLVVYLTGLLTANYLGGRLVRGWERLLLRIPLFNKIYLAAKQVGEAFLSPDKAAIIRGVVLVEYPRRGIYMLAFEVNTVAGDIGPLVTAREGGAPMVAVFIPTPPNPATGNLVFLPRTEVHTLAISTEDALKMVISGGTVTPNAREAEAPRPAVEIGGA